MSFNPNTHYHVQPSNGGCLAALTGRDGSAPFPIRTKSCQDSNDDSILWQFNPDGQGRYFIYNKAWPGKSNRLDLVLQDSTLLYIPWMGPSGDIYNNQRWSVTRSGNTFQISSFGLPGALLTVTELPGQPSLGALLRNDTEVDNRVATWQVLDVSGDSSASSPVPSPQLSAVETVLTPTPKPTTLVTSTLPKTERTILETNQGISSQGAQASSSRDDLNSGKSPISTGRSSTQAIIQTKTSSNDNPTSSPQPPLSASESSSTDLRYLGFIALGLVVLGVVIWGSRRLAKKWQSSNPTLRQDDDLPDQRKSDYGDIMRKFAFQRSAKDAGGEPNESTAQDLPESSTDSASTLRV